MRAPKGWAAALLTGIVLGASIGARAQSPTAARPVQAATVVPMSQDAAPLAGWVAVGLSGFTALLSGGALGIALWARSRAVTASEAAGRRPTPAPDLRMVERLERLEAQVRALATPSGAGAASASARSAADPFPPGAPRGNGAPDAGSGSRLGSDLAAAPAPALRFPDSAPPPEPRATAAEGLLAWSQGLRDDFARLARDPAFAAPDFLARHRPRGAVLGPEGASLLDGFEGAKLWAVRAPGEAEVWALTPGEAAVLNWSAHFAPQRAEVATEVFGPAFDLVPDGEGALRLEEPALVRRDAAGRLSVRRRGRLSGFRG